MTKRKTKSLHIRLPIDRHTALQKAAIKHELSMSQLVNVALKLWLEEHGDS